MDPDKTAKRDMYFMACGASTDLGRLEEHLKAPINRTIREVKVYLLTLPADQNYDDVKQALGLGSIQSGGIKHIFRCVIGLGCRFIGLKSPQWGNVAGTTFPAVHSFILGEKRKGYL